MLLELKAIECGSNDKPIITQEIYDKILEERMDEILEMSREINYRNLVYNFKGPTPSISFSKFGDPMYTYNQLKMVIQHYIKQKNNKKILKNN